jgi:hypothetical protein
MEVLRIFAAPDWGEAIAGVRQPERPFDVHQRRRAEPGGGQASSDAEVGGPFELSSSSPQTQLAVSITAPVTSDTTASVNCRLCSSSENLASSL